MTRKCIEVSEVPANITAGYEYTSATIFPSAGFYYRGNQLFNVADGGVLAAGQIKPEALKDMPEPFAEATLRVAGGISEMTLLKALAIAQNPNLAEKLCL
jgi:hypothetical protein